MGLDYKHVIAGLTDDQVNKFDKFTLAFNYKD